MPDLGSIPVRKYQPDDPYNHLIDNGPIEDLELQIERVNAQVDFDTAVIQLAAGSQSSLAVRLNQSLEDDGSIKTVAIDNALHSISEHIDGGGYVRMTDSERAKLDDIAVEATDLKIEVETLSVTPLFDAGTVSFKNSDSIEWRVSGTEVYADVTFPMTARHQHYYNIRPVTGDFINYVTTLVSTPYRAGSLRVYINGVRISPTSVTPKVKVPVVGAATSITGVYVTEWIEISFDEGVETGGEVTGGDFFMSETLNADDYRVSIDFDISLD